MINDESLNGTTSAFDLQAKTVHYSEGFGDNVVVLGIIGRQIIVV